MGYRIYPIQLHFLTTALLLYRLNYELLTIYIDNHGAHALARQSLL